MLIESVMPQFATMIAEHVVVAADVPTTFDAAVALDLLTVRTPLLAASMWMRGLPALLLRRSEPSSPRLVIGEGITLPGWLCAGRAGEPGVRVRRGGQVLAAGHRVARCAGDRFP